MVKINKTNIGDGYPCYITFEIGPTHEGLESAKRLIKHSSDAGANAVKFQIFDPDRLVADRKQLFSYGVLKNRETGETETVEEPLYDILCRRCLTENQWIEIKKFCDELDIAFFSTVGFDEDVKLLEKLGCLKNADDFVLEDVPYKAPAKDSVSFSIVRGSTSCSVKINFSISIFKFLLIFEMIFVLIFCSISSENCPVLCGALIMTNQFSFPNGASCPIFFDVIFI